MLNDPRLKTMKDKNLTYVVPVDPKTEEPLSPADLGRIFISYKRNEAEKQRDIIIKKIFRLLNYDCAVWFDGNLTGGENYIDEIISSITECHILVLLLTENILKSNFVWEKEVETAKAQHKCIIPIALNISVNDYKTAKEKLGDSIHILSFNSNKEEKDKLSSDANKFDEDFERALKSALSNLDDEKKALQFYNSPKKDTPDSKLIDEEKYIKGLALLKGIGYDANEKEGVKYLDAVINGIGTEDVDLELKSKAILTLDNYYYFTKKDYAASVKYLQKGTSFKNHAILNSLGYMYEKGEGVTQDYTKAKELYEKAAELGNSRAMNNLAVMYDNGNGVTQDYTKAKELYEKAAELGNSRAMTNLAYLYESGEGVTQDYTKAKELYEKAAELGNAYAINNLAYMYDSGNGVTQDYSKAKELYEKAAEFGNSRAMFNLAVMYKNGNGVTQDYAKAKELYEKACELGDSGAMNNLAVMYKNGEGVTQDYSKAKELYEKAAELGNSRAMTNLAYLYESGKGVTQDYSKAKELYEKAAALGDESAKKKIEEMESLINSLKDLPNDNEKVKVPKCLMKRFFAGLLGLIGILLPPLGIIFGIISICLGCNAKKKSGKGKFAIILGIIGLVLSILLIILSIVYYFIDPNGFDKIVSDLKSLIK